MNSLLELAAWDAPLTAEEEGGLRIFDQEFAAELGTILCDHAITNVGTPDSPIWTLSCRHGCGDPSMYERFFDWKAANHDEWAGARLQGKQP